MQPPEIWRVLFVSLYLRGLPRQVARRFRVYLWRAECMAKTKLDKSMHSFNSFRCDLGRMSFKTLIGRICIRSCSCLSPSPGAAAVYFYKCPSPCRFSGHALHSMLSTCRGPLTISPFHCLPHIASRPSMGFTTTLYMRHRAFPRDGPDSQVAGRGYNVQIHSPPV